MTKNEIYKKVIEEVKPLLNDLVVDEYGEYPYEEYVVNRYYNVNSISKICDKVFEETYKLVECSSSSTG